MAERSNAVMDSIIEDLMMRQQPQQLPLDEFVPSAAPPVPKNYTAPRDVTRRKLGPTSQMWGQIAKQMFSDMERAQAKYPYPAPAATPQAQAQEGFPPTQELNAWPLGDNEQVQQ